MSIRKVGKRTPPPIMGTGLDVNAEISGIPGAKKDALFYQDAARLPKVSYGEGIYIYDTEGNQYLDACSGAVSANLGHRHPRMNRAAEEQLNRIAFVYRTQFENQPANDLAEILVRLSPPDLNRAFFVNSGSEAVESSIKLARQYWWATGHSGKYIVIARRPSYHGATLGALAATDYAPLNVPFRPLVKTMPKVSAPYCYHCPLRHTYPECEMACVLELERMVQIYGPDSIAAFITEPIGGATTGACVPPDEYFPMVEKICHDNEILLIIDDVMTGCGRTGTFFGYEHWDITPDIVCSSKGLSGGYTPIGAIIASDTIVEPVLESGGFLHGHTYAGNPLSCAIALEAVRTIIDDGLVENAREIGTYMHERLYDLAERYPFIGDVRGRGLFGALEFVANRNDREPFPTAWVVGLEATAIARDKHGLLVYPRRSLFGLTGDHILIAPPLIIDRAGIDDMIERLDRTLSDLHDLLEQHLEQEVIEQALQIHRRHAQVETVPDYALGNLDQVDAEKDANVTWHMTQDQLVDPEADDTSMSEPLQP